MKRRILFFIESLTCGGAEKSLTNLLPLIDYNRYDVDLLILRRGGVFEKHIPAQVHIIDMSHGGCLRRVCNAVYSLRWRLNSRHTHPRHNAEVLWSSIRHSVPRLKGHYDVAIAYQQGFPTYYIATKVSADRKIAWINVNLINANYRKDFNRPYYDRFDSIAVVSDQLFDIMSRSGFVDTARLTTVYDIVNTDVIRQMSEEFDVDGYFRSGDIKIVTVGRVSAQKNYRLAVETADRLRQRGVRFTWVFVGEGPESADIRHEIDRRALCEYVVMAGLQPNPYPFMRAADIYVQTSSFEGFGLTIAEAKILGRPIVSTDFDVVHDQITDGANGLIAKMDPESVADSICRIIDNDDFRHQLMLMAGSETNSTMDTEIVKFRHLIDQQA